MKKAYILTCALTAAALTFTGCSSAPKDNESGKETNIKETAIRNETSEVSDETTKNSSSLEESQIHALAFGAVLSARNQMNYDTLLGDSKDNISMYQQALEDAWEITDHNSAVETLDWLKTEGHRISEDSDYFGFDEIYKMIVNSDESSDLSEADLESSKISYQSVYDVLKDDYGYTEEELKSVTTLSAWDYDRLITVARWCYGCDYITEEEAWDYINYAAEQGSKDYDSWKTYFAGVMFGRALWSEDSSFSSDNKSIADELLKNKDSIYNTVNFK
jgi:hypothetical protein